ncbi:TPA: NAD-dependent epimerase/dehydratase family protein [Candidatus Poribacteria bacterium]|nr:NAD-dependent epimerase/dehydratase family protein [Candidatus Poribacteria bacterium]HIO10021.1 NAD-dependent epimerase/dehydratase family protein [Candidatus Poribacteria bacterium]HIP10611.1 NAD-dependent epimerase/dehydratase family protein [Rhodospirillales bacterium]
MALPKKVLVTGATGQIGYMTFRRLNEQPEKYDVYALDCKRKSSVRVPSSWTLEIPDDKFHLCDPSSRFPPDRRSPVPPD